MTTGTATPAQQLEARRRRYQAWKSYGDNIQAQINEAQKAIDVRARTVSRHPGWDDPMLSTVRLHETKARLQNQMSEHCKKGDIEYSDFLTGKTAAVAPTEDPRDAVIRSLSARIVAMETEELARATRAAR